MGNQKSHSSDVTDEGWAFVALHLTLMQEDARTHELSALSHSVSSSRNSAAIFAQTPRRYQRLYRCHRLLDLP